jgi:hypothetical protein
MLILLLFSSILVFVTVVIMLVMLDLLLFMVFLAIIFFNYGVFAGVQLSDPSLDAAKMERLAALPTIPKSTPLINWI